MSQQTKIKEIISSVYEKGWRDAGGKPEIDFKPLEQDEATQSIISAVVEEILEGLPEELETLLDRRRLDKAFEGLYSNMVKLMKRYF